MITISKDFERFGHIMREVSRLRDYVSTYNMPAEAFRKKVDKISDELLILGRDMLDMPDGRVDNYDVLVDFADEQLGQLRKDYRKQGTSTGIAEVIA